MDTILWIWLALAVVFGIVEVMTMDLTTIWFVIGSIVAMIIASIGLGLYWQLATFLVVSVLLLIFTRPLVVKKLNIGKTKTNADSLVGDVCIITENVDGLSSTGRAQVRGQSWSVKPASKSATFIVGEKAAIDGIAGVKLIISKLEN
jgi:membrane protein implicated in regulation of membrane protease activity